MSKMMSRCCACLALMLLIAAAVEAQEAPLPAALTLQQALDRALQSHPDVISAQQAAVASQASAVVQRAARWPQLSLEANATQSKGLSSFNSAIGTSTSGSQRTSRNADVALTYTVFRSGLNDQIRQAQTLAQASLLGIPDARRLLAFQVRQDYYNILAQRQLAKSLLQSVANSERHREQAQARLDAGVAARSDLAPIEVEVAQARLQSVQTETNLETALASLRALILAPPATTLDLADPLPTAGYEPRLDEMLALAEQNRPDLAAQRLNIRAAQLATAVAKAEAGIQLSATASGDYGRHTDTTGDEWQLFVGATYPLFDAGASRAGVTQAQAGEAQAEQRLKSLQLGVQQDVESAVAQLRQAATAIEVATVGQRSAETALATAEARYREGLAIIIEVTDAQVQLLQAQVAEVQAKYNYAIALATLAYATATDLPTAKTAAQ